MPKRKKKKPSTRKLDKIMKTECPYISPTLECMLGGFGNLNCLDPKFHENCEAKEKLLRSKRIFSS
jgi:hypothetical protein